MKIDLFNTSEFIDLNKLKPVTSPVLFQRGQIPHPDGLVSNQIFGVTVQSRKSTFAYVDLHGHFFHPHVYKAIKRMFRNIEKLISGEQAYSINEEGILIADNNGETGLEFVYNNWEKINWEKSDITGMRNERVDLLHNFKKDELFTRYLIIIPPFYRDIKSSSSGGGETGDLNRLYANAIRYASMLKEKDMFDFQFNQTNLNMQELLVSIYDYFKTKLEKKTGMLRRYLLGKNVDYCTRSVITAPQFHASSPSDLLVDFRHAAIPIAQVCSLCYPYIIRWIKEFFDREVFSVKESMLVYDPVTDEGKTIALDRPESVFTDKWIKKMIDTFIRDPDSRFNTIELPALNSKQKYYLQFTGRRFDATNKSEISELAYRPLTWTDILYQASVDVTKDKHCLVTRYPLLDEFGIFIARIRVSSTTKTTPVTVGNTLYKWYPVIDFNVPKDKIATKFIDSLQFSNSYLPGLDGDYDGDQTTVKIIFTQEANEECERTMNSKSYFINASGNIIRKIEIEAIQTLYVMTKEPPENSKELSSAISLPIQEMKPSDITFEWLVDNFGNLTSISDGQHSTKNTKSRLNMTDIIKITVPYLGFTGKTTLGRLLYSKIIIEQCGLEKVIGFVNEPVTDKQNGKIEKLIANALKEDQISVDNMYKYVDTRDWLGLQLHAVICTSFTRGSLLKPKEVDDLHKELLKKYKKELENNDEKASEIIEKALIAKTKEVLKDDVGMDLYLSGARGSIENNYKNINLTRGAVKNLQTGGYDIIKGSLMDGLEKKDMAAHSNNILMGAYPKAVGTQVSGYLAKELSSAMQTEVLGPEGSDCGTTKGLTVTIPKVKFDDYLYRYIIEDGKLICLTPEVIQKYIGKEVVMRSPMYCIAKDCICSKCAGEDFYKLGKTAIGLIATKVATTCSRMNMKKFHENLVKTQDISLEDIFL